MAEVTIRELRNHSGKVINRVLAGERLTVTRWGVPVAELVPLPKTQLPAPVILQRWRALPSVDPDRLRSEIDLVIDQTV